MASGQEDQTDHLIDEGRFGACRRQSLGRQLRAFRFVVVSGRVVDRIVKPDRGVHQRPLVVVHVRRGRHLRQAVLNMGHGVIAPVRLAVARDQLFANRTGDHVS